MALAFMNALRFNRSSGIVYSTKKVLLPISDISYRLLDSTTSLITVSLTGNTRDKKIC